MTVGQKLINATCRRGSWGPKLAGNAQITALDKNIIMADDVDLRKFLVGILVSVSQSKGIKYQPVYECILPPNAVPYVDATSSEQSNCHGTTLL